MPTLRQRLVARFCRMEGVIESDLAAHRPPLGVTAEPPPTGADLERRRRFH